MDNDSKKNVPLVNVKRENTDVDLKDIYFYSNREIREGNRRLRIYKDLSKKIVVISVAAAISIPVFGAGLYVNGVLKEVKAEEEQMNQPVYGENFDETRPFAPEYLVFDEVIRDVEGGGEYRVVVNKYGDCSFVNMNYETPFQILNGIYCEEAAENLGFDFDSLTFGRSK